MTSSRSVNFSHAAEFFLGEYSGLETLFDFLLSLHSRQPVHDYGERSLGRLAAGVHQEPFAVGGGRVDKRRTPGNKRGDAGFEQSLRGCCFELRMRTRSAL